MQTNRNYSAYAGQLSQESILKTNKVIRNTYLLLSMTLAFSALTAWLGMQVNFMLSPILTLPIYFVLLFATNKCRNSSTGIYCVFALTGFLGFTLGPLLRFYLALPNGSELVMTALGGTALAFFALSAYALKTRKNFSFMSGFLFTGILVAFIASLVGVFFHLPGLMLAVSAIFIVLMSGVILYQTSEMVHGGETNYISATVSLYVSLYNMFVSLLNLLGAFRD